ncbi:hypothetical protein B0H12DRAFT_1120895 [Mycena haematopus]|nr:hypothetical protein B0H12DRAFT_1120895 [Mycena haematopus]
MDSSGSSLRPRATRSYQELPADVRRLRAATRLWRAAIKSYQKGDLATGLRELLWLPNATYTSAFFLMLGDTQALDSNQSFLTPGNWSINTGGG